MKVRFPLLLIQSIGKDIPVTSRFVRRSEEIGTMFIGKDNMKELADDPNFVAETCPAGTLPPLPPLPPPLPQDANSI